MVKNIIDTSNDVLEQILTRVKSFYLNSIQSDESPDIKSLFDCYVNNGAISKDFLFYKALG